MNHPEHVLLGIVFGAAFALLIGAEPFLFASIVFVAAFSALVPDIDHDSSKIRGYADLGVPICAFLFSYTASCNGVACGVENWHPILVSTLAIAGLYMIVMTYMKPRHRGITHTLLLAAGYGMAIWFFSNMNFGVAAFLGYLSHLAGDRMIKVI
ncbi:MAG: metal-dependent hydrolase [Candidatus Micrarchaeota archaeon]|nr:metal-dependent hydrolase [Candidatus Micrarchaeota archaeon]